MKRVSDFIPKRVKVKSIRDNIVEKVKIWRNSLYKKTFRNFGFILFFMAAFILAFTPFEKRMIFKMLGWITLLISIYIAYIEYRSSTKCHIEPLINIESQDDKYKCVLVLKNIGRNTAENIHCTLKFNNKKVPQEYNLWLFHLNALEKLDFEIKGKRIIGNEYLNSVVFLLDDIRKIKSLIDEKLTITLSYTDEKTGMKYENLNLKDLCINEYQVFYDKKRNVLLRNGSFNDLIKTLQEFTDEDGVCRNINSNETK